MPASERVYTCTSLRTSGLGSSAADRKVAANDQEAADVEEEKEAADEEEVHLVPVGRRGRKDAVADEMMLAGYEKGNQFRREQIATHVLTVALSLFARACDMQDPAIVIDPFAGTHSTGAAAHSMGCHYVGMDKDPASKVLLTQTHARTRKQ